MKREYLGVQDEETIKAKIKTLKTKAKDTDSKDWMNKIETFAERNTEIVNAIERAIAEYASYGTETTNYMIGEFESQIKIGTSSVLESLLIDGETKLPTLTKDQNIAINDLAAKAVETVSNYRNVIKKQLEQMVNDASTFKELRINYAKSVKNRGGDTEKTFTDVKYLDRSIGNALSKGYTQLLMDIYLPKLYALELDYVYYLSLILNPNLPKKNPNCLKDPNTIVSLSESQENPQFSFIVPSTVEITNKIKSCENHSAYKPWLDLILKLAMKYEEIMKMIKSNLDGFIGGSKKAHDEMIKYLGNINDIVDFTWLVSFIDDVMAKPKSLSETQNADIKKKIEDATKIADEYKKHIQDEMDEMMKQLTEGANKIANIIQIATRTYKLTRNILIPIGETFKGSIGKGYGKSIGHFQLYKLKNEKISLENALKSIILK